MKDERPTAVDERRRKPMPTSTRGAIGDVVRNVHDIRHRKEPYRG